MNARLAECEGLELRSGPSLVVRAGQELAGLKDWFNTSKIETT